MPHFPKLADVLKLKEPLDPKFFANAELQSQAPGAFALQPEAAAFHETLDNSADRQALAKVLRAFPQLAHFDELSWAEQEPLLKAVFTLECQTLNIEPPQLVIEDDATPGPAFFDFDLENPGPGKVILNPKALAGMNDGFAPLLLLIHETRHSAQFQHAFSGAEDPVAEGYRAAFQAQRSLQGFSFVDFTTLLNEYEAFQFANGVVSEITGGRANTLRMGTLAGQYDESGKLKVDLKEMFRQTEHDQILDQFNELERSHYDQLKGRTLQSCCQVHGS